MNRIEIGYIARAHGIRGEVRVACHDIESSPIDALEALWIGDELLSVASVRAAKDFFIVKFESVGDRTAAEALKGRTVYANREDLAEEGEVLLADLVGCRVVLEDGSDYGVVVAIDAGFQDRMVIVHGDIERQLPVVDAFIKDIDLTDRVIVVAPPEGLPEAARR